MIQDRAVRMAVLLLLLFPACAQTAGATALGTNLIANPGGDAGIAGPTGYEVVAVPGWESVGTPTVVSWTTGSGFPVLSDPGPAVRGANFFTGGPSEAVTELRQVLDVTDLAAGIDTGTLPYKLAGYVGGFNGQEDNARVVVTFRSAGLGTLGSAQIGPVTVADRNSLTALLYRQASGTVPPGTRSMLVQLSFERLAGSYNDGYADSLALVLGEGVADAVGTTRADAPWLAAAAPNPAGQPVNLRFTLPRATVASLEVLDVRGRRVRTLAAGTLQAGEHARTWDLRDDAGREAGRGLYFVRLRAEGLTRWAKVTVLR